MNKSSTQLANTRSSSIMQATPTRNAVAGSCANRKHAHKAARQEETTERHEPEHLLTSVGANLPEVSVSYSNDAGQRRRITFCMTTLTRPPRHLVKACSLGALDSVRAVP